MQDDINDLQFSPDALQAAAVAKDRNATPDESFDAKGKLSKSIFEAGLTPRIDKNLLIKAVQSVEKFSKYEKYGKPKSGRSDPLGLFQQVNYMSRPAPLGFNQLRSVPSYDPTIAGIVFTMLRDLTAHAKPVEHDSDTGFRITLDNRKGPLSDADQKRIRWLEKFVLNCGAEFDYFAREWAKRDSFVTFLNKAGLDTLTMDAMPIEVIRTLSGKVHGWVHVDGATCYRAPDEGLLESTPLPDGVDPSELPERHYVKAIEVDETNAVCNWFGYEDLIYEVRNPRPDHYGRGYGIAETELLLRAVTASLNVITYNERAYSDNHIPKGILNIWGDFGGQDTEALKSELGSYLTGMQWELPIILHEKGKEAGATFTKTGVEVSEMQFMKFWQVLEGWKFGVFGMAPESVHQESASSKGATLSSGSVQSKIDLSKNQGYAALLQHFDNVLSILVGCVDDEAQFRWTGFVDAKDVWERDQLALNYGQLLERQGLPLTGNKLLDNAPVNPAMHGIYLQSQQPQGEDSDEGEFPQQEGQDDPNAEDNEQPQQDPRRFFDLAQQLRGTPN